MKPLNQAFFLILSVCIGLTLSTALVLSLPAPTVDYLTGYLSDVKVPAAQMQWYDGWLGVLRDVGIVAACCLHVWLTPLLYLNCAYRGFTMGLSACVLAMRLGMRGVLSAAVLSLPTLIITLPAIIVLSLAASGVAYNRLRHLTTRRTYMLYVAVVGAVLAACMASLWLRTALWPLYVTLVR